MSDNNLKRLVKAASTLRTRVEIFSPAERTGHELGVSIHRVAVKDYPNDSINSYPAGYGSCLEHACLDLLNKLQGKVICRDDIDKEDRVYIAVV